MHIQSFYNPYNPFRPLRTTLKSVRTGTGSDQTVDPVMDENGGLSLLSGDVKGDAVFTYGLSQNHKEFGFSSS